VLSPKSEKNDLLRVCVDTNIVVSAAFNPYGPPGRVMRLVTGGVVFCFVSSEILSEMHDVFFREGVRQRIKDPQMILSSFLSFCSLVDITERVSVVLNDPSDNKFIECAIAAKADFIVSGDDHLLALRKFRGIRIVDSQEFLRIIETNS
jgi:uncharacterized protein